MKALKYLLFLLLIAVIGFSIYVALQPNSYKITVKKTIDAPAPVVYDLVNDFNNWDSWLSLTNGNPELVLNVSDHSSGPDSYLSWDLKNHSGSIKTTGVNPNKMIDQEISYKNFPSLGGIWGFNQNDNATDVSFTLASENLSFSFKAKSILKGGIEKQIEPELVEGLNKLDSFVVARMHQYSIKVDGITNHSGGYYLYTTTSCKLNAFTEKMEASLSSLKQYVTENNITTGGAPFTLFYNWDRDNNAVVFSSCIPTTEKVITTSSEILTGQLEPFKALKTTLQGNYSNLNEAWQKANDYISQYGLKAREDGPMLELYVTDPQTTPNPADWVTEIFIALE
ncbi:GyrI-like domain-containing protein [Gaetbulibacter aestuarii]|uniref:GyrI-like domain-containing protein n=1 Tax=Gaetbulibacter aestuarii TaxID=1502358 RepID=A0ABW7N0T7_9FLAO